MLCLSCNRAMKVLAMTSILWIVMLLACQETVNEVKENEHSNQSTRTAEVPDLVKPEKLPTILKQVQPSYPEAARKAGIEGLVVVEVLVDTAGNVEKAQIVRSVPELDQAAIEAVRKFRFNPATLDDKPVSSWITIPIHFKLSDDK
ncbi:MAG: energy transducer TonB [bacterium]|nr:MAG: energy transducer TonB [bacterium]